MQNLFLSPTQPTMVCGFIREGQLYKQEYKWVTNSTAWSWDYLVSHTILYYSTPRYGPYIENKPYDVACRTWKYYWIDQYPGALVGKPRETIFADVDKLLDWGMKGIYVPYGTAQKIEPKSYPCTVNIGSEMFVLYLVTNLSNQKYNKNKEVIIGPPSATFAYSSLDLAKSGYIGNWTWGKMIQDETLLPDSIQRECEKAPSKQSSKVDWDVMYSLYSPYMWCSSDVCDSAKQHECQTILRSDDWPLSVEMWPIHKELKKIIGYDKEISKSYTIDIHIHL